MLYKNVDIYFYFCYYTLNLKTTTDLRHNIITYNSYDFSPNIDCWEKFLGDDLLPTDSDVMEIIKESDSDPLPENIYQEILLMRVGNKLLSEAVKKAKTFLNHFNSVSEEKVLISEDFEIETQIESNLRLNWFVNARDTHFYVKIPYFTGSFYTFCRESGKFYGCYYDEEEVEPAKSEEFDDLINIIAFYYCYDKLYYSYLIKYNLDGKLADVMNLLEE